MKKLPRDIDGQIIRPGDYVLCVDGPEEPALFPCCPRDSEVYKVNSVCDQRIRPCGLDAERYPCGGWDGIYFLRIGP